MSKKNTIYFASSLLLLLVLVMPACDWAKKKTEGAAAEVKQELGLEPKVRLLDANSVEVYNDAHIPGAVQVSTEGLEELAKGWNKKTPTVVYCSTVQCGASHQIAKKLKELGFEDVAVFSGGIHEWYTLSEKDKAKYPIEGEAKQGFLKEKLSTVEPKAEEGVRLIKADELGKLLEESKAPAAAPAQPEKA